MLILFMNKMLTLENRDINESAAPRYIIDEDSSPDANVQL